MLVYSYKTKKCPLSTSYWHNNRNLMALNNYNKDLFERCSGWQGQAKFLKDVFLSYSTLCEFNNSLTDITTVDDYFITSLDFVKVYIRDNVDILTSIDNKCRKIYEDLDRWYKRLIANPECLDSIKMEVVRCMKFHERQGMFKISSINLKRNYYDFVV